MRAITFQYMKRNVVLLIVTAAVITMIALTAGFVISDSGGSIDQAPPINETTPEQTPITSASTPPSQGYVVVANNTDQINTTQLERYGNVGVTVGTRIEIEAVPKNVTAIEAIAWVEGVRPAVRSETAAVPGASNGTSLGVEQLHTDGIAGDGITVGIIDGGFEPSNPAIHDQVVDTESFVMAPEDPSHGTSVAEVVARTAPESELHLVSATTGIQTEAAIEYLIAQNVDMIVASWGFPTVEDDGDHFLTDEVTQAENNGIPFIVSAGNAAQTHWEGEFSSTDGDGVHEWTTSGAERNCIPDCQTQFSGSVNVYLRWTDQGEPSDYAIGLYNPSTEEYVATQTETLQTETNSYAYLGATVASQPLDLVVQNTAGASDDEIEVMITGPRSMEYTVPESSMTAPADVPAAFSVAAYEPDNNRVAPYSSQGPTDDGRQGIDVTGYTNINVENGLYGQTSYTFAGTSAAAPYVGGVMALVAANSANGSASAATTLRSSSDDIKTAGSDTVSGAGVVNATAAVDATGQNDTTGPTTDPATVTSAVQIGGQQSNVVYQAKGGTAYQGQAIVATGEHIHANADNYTLQEATSVADGTVTASQEVATVETFVIGQDDDELPAYIDPSEFQSGEAFLVLNTTTRPAGDYFISGGSTVDTPDVGTGTFELVLQDLSVGSGAGTPVSNSSSSSLTAFEVDSNRVGYSANITTAETLDAQTLVEIFVNTGGNDAGSTVAIDGNSYDESAIEAGIVAAREHVQTDRDGEIVVETTGTVEIEDTDGQINTVTVSDLLDTAANPFNVLVYALDEKQSTSTITLVDISNPREDIDFAGVPANTYTVTGSVADTTATATTTLEVTDSTESETTVAVQLDGAPNGLQRYNVTVDGPANTSITKVTPGEITGDSFEITDGGVGASTITARGVDLAGAVGSTTTQLTLYEFTVASQIKASEFDVTVHQLEADDGTQIGTDRLSLSIPQSEDNPFTDGIAGAGSAPPTDTDGDGLYDDVNGDGQADFDDAVTLAFVDATGLTETQRTALDFDGDGDLDFDDAVELAFST